MKVQFVKVGPDLFRCVSPADVDAVAHIAIGELINSEFRKTRNYAFLKKFFALLKTGFEAWPDPEPFTVNGLEVFPQKDFEAFREFITIKCGFYSVHGLPDGSVRLDAKSISFAKMKETEFEKLFSKAIDVMLWHVLPRTWSEADLMEGITRNEQSILQYAA